jgi:hypothetical protein
MGGFTNMIPPQTVNSASNKQVWLRFKAINLSA